MATEPANAQADRLAVVLLSGGLDSAVMLKMAQTQGFRCVALSVDYGQRHRQELEAATGVASKARVEHVVLTCSLGALGGSSLTDTKIPIPKDRAREDMAQGVTTYVPGRNTVLLSLALALAETRGAKHLFIGANYLDRAGYPDCREEFLSAFEQAIRHLGEYTVHAPLSGLTKNEIVSLGRVLEVPLHLTHSCYDPSESGACGRCDACVLREDALTRR